MKLKRDKGRVGTGEIYRKYVNIVFIFEILKKN